MSVFFYNIFIQVYLVGIRVAALNNPKATLWLQGRLHIFDALQQWANGVSKYTKIVWVHCASLGEFEQARPIIEKLRLTYPSSRILLTFFSPSGYQIRKNFKGVDAVFYLPIDTKKNAKQFLKIVKPSLVIWVKYDYWYHYLTQLKQQQIPVLLVSAIFSPNQPFFKWYGYLWKQMLQTFTHLFVQNEASLSLLCAHSLGYNAILAGDTRFDRVIDIANNMESTPALIASFCQSHTVIVAGSTWLDDELALVHYARTQPQIKFIIAPHEVDNARIAELKKLFTSAVLYSQLTEYNANAQVLIIDNIGMLASLYPLATVAYIGGGFNASGIHNILEAAVHAKPIIFGSEYHKFNEATSLIALGGAYSIDTALQLEALLNKLLSQPMLMAEVGAINKNYVYSQSGATDIIMQQVRQIVA